MASLSLFTKYEVGGQKSEVGSLKSEISHRTSDIRPLTSDLRQMLSKDEIKKYTAQQAVALVQNNSIVGLGSGTTAWHFTVALGALVKKGFTVTAVPTSHEIKKLAIEQGITITELNNVTAIDLTVDGADEIDPSLQLIKGGGGALLQEKMVAAVSKKLVIVADDSKLVKQLGKFPLPLEVVPYGWKQVQRVIEKKYSIKTTLRLQNNQPFITDHGHYILNCPFQTIANAPVLCSELNLIPGVVDNGLFIGLAQKAIIGYEDGSFKTIEG